MPSVKRKMQAGEIGREQGWDPPEILKSVILRIKTLYDPKENVGPHDSILQTGLASLIVDDKPVGDIKLTLWNNPLPKTARGKTIILASARNRENHLSGVEYVIDEYTDKQGSDVQQECIKVNSNAVITYVGGESVKQEERHKNVKSGMKWTYREIATAVALAHRTTVMVVEEVYGDIFKKLPEAAQQAFISTVFIQAFDRQGGAEAWFGERVKQEQPETSEPESEFDPANWACAIVPTGKKYKGKTLGEIGKAGLAELYEFMASRQFKFNPQGFADCVKQAGEDLNLEVDDIP